MPGPTVISIGTFDGAHAGHQALIQRCRVLATQASASPTPRVLAIVLDPHPMTHLRPAAVPPLLTTFAQRAALLRESGADDVIALALTPDLLNLAPTEFIRSHLVPLNPIAVVEGPDFRFGKNRAGDTNTLANFAWGRPFSAVTIDPVEVVLSDLSLAPARSTLIRWLLASGRVSDAGIILSRPHRLMGIVIKGDRRGRTIGYPTANLDTPNMLPADGIYATVAHLPGGRSLPAALSIGTKPTFGTSPRTAEAFILDQSRTGGSWRPLAGLPEYGWPLALDVIAWVRDQVKFGGLSSLVAQIGRDCDEVHRIIQRRSSLCTFSTSPLPQESHA